MDSVKTVDVRLLVRDDVDERFLIEQLVSNSSGSGAPIGAAVLVDDTSWISQVDSGCVEPKVIDYVFTRIPDWNGDEL